MNSTVPYLLRAINEWVLDNNCTPYLIVDATVSGTDVPLEHVKDGQIVLNISPQAIRHLVMANEHVMFSGRFNGVAREIYVPIEAVLGLVTRENGEGMWFPRDEEAPQPDPTEPPPAADPPTSGKPSLKVVK